jgi:hypothetical protein
MQIRSLSYDRMEEEKKAHQALISDSFFTPHEMATIAVLSDIIFRLMTFPAVQRRGVPGFIAFIVKDKPSFKHHAWAGFGGLICR